MSLRRLLLVVACVVAATPAPARRAAQPSSESEGATAPTRAYVRSIPDRATFDSYSRVIGADRLTKFIIDIKSGEVYFIDVNLFRIHADFVLGVLLKQEWTAENVREYNKNYERDKPRFILGYVTEHLKVGRFTFSFWEGDKIDAKGIAEVRKKLDERFFVKNLPFRPDSPAQEKVAREVAELGVATLTNDSIYKSAPYQAFNNGECVGRLRVVPIGTPYESLIFDRGDVVLLQEAYPDISPVAGILSARSSTPLAHVNLRARAWGIPNSSLTDARDKYAALDGQVVYYRVADKGLELRKATAAEIAEHEALRRERREVRIPPADLEVARMPMLTEIRAEMANVYGAKTANLGEIARARLAKAQVPSGFGVPFFYYQRHMTAHGLNARVGEILADPRWNEPEWRRASLERLRTAILDAPMDPEVLDAIYKRVRLKLGGRGVFVRSSTNAEDLEGFNGAGLYDTVPNVRGKEALGRAVKQVWASLWNYRAVEERELFGIDHEQTYSGVLIQVGVDATAAGVLVTDNLFDPSDDSSYTINAKWGLGIRVVEGTKVPEQIIYDPSNDGTRIICRSDDPVMLVFDEKGGIREVPTASDGVILSEDRARRLAAAIADISGVMAVASPLDVEWLLEGEKIWIVQARPYVGGR